MKCEVKELKIEIIDGQEVEVKVYESAKPTEVDAIHLPLTHAERSLAKSCRKDYKKYMEQKGGE